MFTHTVGDSNLLLTVTENHTSNKWPNHFSIRFPLINQCWVRLRGDAQMRDATRILASSTKMRNSFAIFADELHPLYL